MHANVQQTSSISQTAAEFKSEYETRAVEGNYSIEDVGYFSYDAVWILALALNNTMTMVDSSCLLYTSPSPRDATLSRMPSSA